MNDFKWDDSLLIGVNKMDDQHKILINYINELVNEIEKGGDLLKPFDTMAAYVVKHFEEEEQFMLANKYEGFATHKIIHEKLITNVKNYRQNIIDKNLDSDNLIAFLKMWLKSHIRGIDTKYAAAINAA